MCFCSLLCATAILPLLADSSAEVDDDPSPCSSSLGGLSSILCSSGESHSLSSRDELHHPATTISHFFQFVWQVAFALLLIRTAMSTSPGAASPPCECESTSSSRVSSSSGTGSTLAHFRRFSMFPIALDLTQTSLGNTNDSSFLLGTVRWVSAAKSVSAQRTMPRFSRLQHANQVVLIFTRGLGTFSYATS